MKPRHIDTATGAPTAGLTLGTSLLSLRLLYLFPVLLLEAIFLLILPNADMPMSCQQVAAKEFCEIFHIGLRAGVAFATFMTLILIFEPRLLRLLLVRGDLLKNRLHWIGLHFGGIALIFLPYAFADFLIARADTGLPTFVLALFWGLGATSAALGAMFWLVDPGDWGRWLRQVRYAPIAAFIVIVMVVQASLKLQVLWTFEMMQNVTNSAVLTTLRMLGEAPVSTPEDYIVGLNGFVVSIGSACSGVEGFGLVIGFTILSAILFRSELRFPHFWLMLPLGLAASWVFNVIRISVLIMIGAHVSPDLAVGGFHSYAGWIFFTFIAMSVIFASRSFSFFRAKPVEVGQLPRIRHDWNAACILPFVATMLISTFIPAFFHPPQIGYPLKALVMAGALAYFAHHYRRIAITFDPIAIAVGAAVGLLWIAMLPASDPNAAPDDLTMALAVLSGSAYAFWAVTRVLGTVLLIPIIEELFFRGYILRRLDGDTPRSRWIALAISTALFAALHGKWLAAGIAGLAFGLVMMRRGRLFDAILAHGVANLIVALWAWLQGDWNAI